MRLSALLVSALLPMKHADIPVNGPAALPSIFIRVVGDSVVCGLWGIDDNAISLPLLRLQNFGSAGDAGALPSLLVEDDGQEDRDASQVRLTVNGQLSLQEAREHYSVCGAADPGFLPYVREPQVSELQANPVPRRWARVMWQSTIGVLVLARYRKYLQFCV